MKTSEFLTTAASSKTAISVMQALGRCTEGRLQRCERQLTKWLQRQLCLFAQRFHARCVRIFVLEDGELRSIVCNWPDVAQFCISLSDSSNQNHICKRGWIEQVVVTYRSVGEKSPESEPLSSLSLSELVFPIQDSSGEAQALIHAELDRPVAGDDLEEFAELTREMTPKFSKRIHLWQNLHTDRVLPVASTRLRERNKLTRDYLGSIQKGIDKGRCHVMLWEVDWDAKHLVVRGTTGHDQPFADEDLLPLDHSRLGYVVKHYGKGECFYTEDVQNDSRFNRNDTAVAMGVRQMLAVSIFEPESERPTHVICIYSFDRKMSRDWLPVDFPTQEAMLGLAELFSRILSREKRLVHEAAKNALTWASLKPNRLSEVVRELKCVTNSKVVMYRVSTSTCRVVETSNVSKTIWDDWGGMLTSMAHSCFRSACKKLTKRRRKPLAVIRERLNATAAESTSLNVLTLACGTGEFTGLCIQLIRRVNRQFTAADVELATNLLRQAYGFCLHGMVSHTVTSITHNEPEIIDTEQLA